MTAQPDVVQKHGDIIDIGRGNEHIVRIGAYDLRTMLERIERLESLVEDLRSGDNEVQP